MQLFLIKKYLFVNISIFVSMLNIWNYMKINSLIVKKL